MRLGENGIGADLAETVASVGGGSLPGGTLESWAVALQPAAGDRVDALAQRLRLGSTSGTGPGVFGRIEDGRLLLDMRTVLPENDALLTRAVAAAYRHVG